MTHLECTYESRHVLVKSDTLELTPGLGQTQPATRRKLVLSLYWSDYRERYLSPALAHDGSLELSFQKNITVYHIVGENC